MNDRQANDLWWSAEETLQSPACCEARIVLTVNRANRDNERQELRPEKNRQTATSVLIKLRP